MKQFVSQVYASKSTPNSTAVLVGQESRAEFQSPHDRSHEDSQPTLETALVEKLEPAQGLDEAPKSCDKVLNSCRTDSGKLHRVRHGILSREVLVGLVRLGEDLRRATAIFAFLIFLCRVHHRCTTQPGGQL